MTTPLQQPLPQQQQQQQQPPQRATRSRKRPAPGSAPLPHSASAPSTSVDMNNYLSNPAAAVNPNLMYDASSIPTTQPETGVYGPQPSGQQQPQQQHQHQQGMAMYGAPGDGQVARLQRGNQLIRMPSFQGMAIPTMPPGMGAPGLMGMNMGNMGMMGQAGALMQQPAAYGTQGEMLDQDLFKRIDKMKKQRATIPPFVLKLSRYVSCFLFVLLGFCGARNWGQIFTS